MAARSERLIGHMRTVAVAAAALNQTPIAWDGNVRNILIAIAEAKRIGAQVLCLPELCVTGYGCEDAFHSAGILQTALTHVLAIAPRCRGLAVNLGLPVEVNGAIYNAACLVVNGKIAGFVAKENLAGDGLHYEPRWFKPWPSGNVTSIEVGGVSYPFGDLFFDIGGIKLGFEICEDAWVGERRGIELAAHGVDIMLNPSASHFAFGKHEIRRRFVQEGSRAFGVAYVYSNLLGCESGRIIYDGDTLIASHGEVIARGSRFSYKDVVVTGAAVDLERTRLIRFRQGSFRPQINPGDRCVKVSGFRFSRTKMGAQVPHPVWEASPELKHEEFFRSVSLGLFDYLRKSKSHGFVVSLSGGVDSSSVSCLVALMVKAALSELGLPAFKEKLSFIPWLRNVRSEKDIISHMLACVYQGTKNSSATTEKAAREVATEIGATFYNLDVSALVRGYEDLVSKAVRVKLSWDEHDLARQNIQARVRSPSVWLVANLRRALLLSTSNRSEASVGYTTMDGDSSGGLSPLGGIDKAYLREWLKWLEIEGPYGLTNYPSLKLVNVQAPTAELRPSREKQTDEKDLMPYVVLDRIERYAVRDKLLPRAVLERVVEDFEGRYTANDLKEWVVHFFRLWSQNQWKRERYAPSFHVDDESVDPKTWCRFPILSGGFAAELEALGTPRGRKK